MAKPAKKKATFNLDEYDNERIDSMNMGDVCAFVKDVADNCPERAKEAIERYAKWLQYSAARRGVKRSLKEARDIAREHIGWYIGYYDNDERVRLEKVFKDAFHPLWGKPGKTTKSGGKNGDQIVTVSVVVAKRGRTKTK